MIRRTTTVISGIVLLCIAASRCPAEETLTADELALIRAAERHRVQTIEKVYGAVIAIYGSNRQGGGSGVIYDPSGLALTNHHVVAAAGTAGWGGLADGRLYRWKLVGTDPGGDVAIIKLSGRDSFPYAPLGDSDKVRVGDFAMAMGNPFVLAEDQTPTVTLGIVSGVNRYQDGTGRTGNMLVYGNCIQVDSSINPGNSGGPLFNMDGEVIGINGRGSFKERGRVNVGLGYAISAEQIKNFIPDLLATKVAQHGTLDAQFSDRTGGVICDALNLDSPAARAGLELGDRLVSFEGESVETANEFTNLISTFPADWPAEFVVERDDQRRTLRVRLVALPYDPPPQPPKPTPEPGGEDRGDGKLPVEAPRPGSKHKPKEAPSPARRPRGPRVDTSNPGVVRNEQLNRENCRYVLQQWRRFTGETSAADGDVRGFEIIDDVLRDGEKVGRQRILLAADGRFRLDYDAEAARETVVFDGEGYLRSSGAGGRLERVNPTAALDGPVAWQAAVLASALGDRPLENLGEVLLEGGDKARARRSFRVAVQHDGFRGLVWLSLFDEEGRPQVRLLKSGHTLDSARPRPAVAYDDWRSVSGVRLPFHRRVVAGLAESVELEFITTSCRELQSLPNDLAP